MRATILITTALLILGCGFKKEAKPTEQDSAGQAVEKPGRFETPQSSGARARASGAKSELDKVREESKQKRDKRINEIFDQ